MRRMKKMGPNVLYDLNDLLFFLTISVYTLFFHKTIQWPTLLSLRVLVSLHSNLCGGLQMTLPFSNRVPFGCSRSSKVDDFDTNRNRICYFLLVRHCDYGPILHRF